jgi:hypothetical protein
MKILSILKVIHVCRPHVQTKFGSPNGRSRVPDWLLVKIVVHGRRLFFVPQDSFPIPDSTDPAAFIKTSPDVILVFSDTLLAFGPKPM